MQDIKLKEASDYIKNAEKAAKKSWFSSPDFGIAAQHYDQAANCYKTIKYYKPAKETYILASENYIKANSYFMAAKAYEQGANMALNLNEYDQSYEYFNSSSEYYKHCGSMDIAAQLLEKVAKTFEPIDIDKAVELLAKACETYTSEEKGKFAIEAYRRWAGLLIKDKRWQEADKVLKEMKSVTDGLANPSTSNKILLSQMLCWLAFGDEIAAKKVMDFANESRGFVGSSEYELASDLLNFYSEGDQEAWLQTISKNAIHFLDTEIARTAKQIKLPGIRATKSVSKEKSQEIVQEPLTPTQTISSAEPVPGNSVPDAKIEESDDDSLC